MFNGQAEMCVGAEVTGFSAFDSRQRCKNIFRNLLQLVGARLKIDFMIFTLGEHLFEKETVCHAFLIQADSIRLSFNLLLIVNGIQITLS